MKTHLILAIITLSILPTVRGEVIFADYFDIAWGASQGTEVMGKVNLKRNKDYKTDPIPSSYKFLIEEDSSESFEINTEFDPKGRIFGVITVKQEVVLPEEDKDFNLVISLVDKGNLLCSKSISIHLREETLWSTIRNNYLPMTTEVTKLYGRFTYTDEELEETIDELIRNDGKFRFSRMYESSPTDYGVLKERRSMTTDQKAAARSKGIEGDWKNVLKHIGGLGFAYAHSAEFGVKAKDPTRRERLKRAIYLSAYQFMSNVGVEGDAVLIDGKPAGPYLGDGFVTLHEHKLLSHGLCTHQWELTDALASPLAHIMPMLLEDKANGDPLAQNLFNVIRDYFQLFFAEVRGRRAMDDKTGRWREIQDDKRSNGAWSDANIGHRWRCLMLLPIVFADYNQPITYVPYWYDDFFNGTEYEGKTYARHFSPRGVLSDLRSLSQLFSVSSFEYAQSGFNPDGTVSHHCDHASDVAMQDYGFHWLVNPISEARFWNGSEKPIDIKALQFIADRLTKVYSTIIFKNRLDFTVIGRSHLANTKKFVETELLHDGEFLLNLIPDGKKLNRREDLMQLLEGIRSETHRHDVTKAYWNADYVLHRRESGEDEFFFSVKNKSVRTVGAEDFSEIRKSWHFGSGVFQLKVAGDEYYQIRLNKWDHHTVPGVTEEWRIDPLPSGHASASGPGLNEFSGQLADGQHAMAAYHHKPGDDYTSANALKSYFMSGNIGTAVGTDVKRVRKGQNRNIVTTIDQIYFDSPITISISGKISRLMPDESHDLELLPEEPFWIHHGKKGYLIFPESDQRIFIKTNDKVNVTNAQEETFIKHYTGHYYLPSPEFGTAVMALDHGRKPRTNMQNAYHYTMVANVKAEDMPSAMEEYLSATTVKKAQGTYHAVHENDKSLIQASFFAAGIVRFGEDEWLRVDQPALVMMKKNHDTVTLSVSNPLHTLNVQTLVLETGVKLQPGRYSYDLKGIQPQEGEHFIVEETAFGSRITVELPDSTDAERYNYQDMMYAGSPLVTKINRR